MLTTERILLAVFISSFLMSLHLVVGTDILLVLSGTALSLFYFLLSLALFTKVPIRQIFKNGSLEAFSKSYVLMSILLGLGLSEACLGILFRALYLPGGDFLLLIASVVLSIAFVYGLMHYQKHKKLHYKHFMQRAFGFLLVSICLYLIPNRAIVHYKYSEYPEYLKAREAAMAQPENEALWEKLDKEAEKINKPKK